MRSIDESLFYNGKQLKFVHIELLFFLSMEIGSINVFNFSEFIIVDVIEYAI
jgi:hypothetical protein